MQEYRLSTRMTILYGLTAAVLVIFSGFTLSKLPAPGPRIPLLFLLILVTLAILIVINIMRRSVVIDDTGILCVNLFTTKRLDFTQIRGYRLGQKTIRIEPLSPGDPTIVIRNYRDFNDSDALNIWTRTHLKDLDAADLDNERQDFSQNASFGSTPAERQQRFAAAKGMALAFNIWSPALCFVMMFFTNWFSSIILFLFPLLGIGLIMFSKGIIKFTSNSMRSAYPFIMPGMILPSFMLLASFSIGGYTIFQYHALWWPAAIIGAVIFLLLFFVSLNQSAGSMAGQIILMLIVALLYGFGSTLRLNCACDSSRPEKYTATVLHRHKEFHGRGTTYLLRLSPWGPRYEEEETTVRRALYDASSIGDTVHINLKEGLLHIPWFTVTLPVR